MEDLLPLPLKRFLPYCRVEGRSLTQREHLALTEKIQDRARVVARAVRASGRSFDALAVDFIISSKIGADGLPEPYFLECAAHFAGEERWNREQLGPYGSFRRQHFFVAAKRAAAYKQERESGDITPGSLL